MAEKGYSLCYNSSMIIDFHTHIFPQSIVCNREKYIARDPVFAELYSNPKAKLVDSDELIKNMDEQEIDISVILNISWQDPDLCRESNDYIIESIGRHPSRLIGFGMAPLNSPETAISEIERCAQNGLRGIGEIRLSPEEFRNTEKLKPVIQKLIDYNLVLLTHSSEPAGHIYPGKGNITPEVLYPFITAFPSLKLICAHWGGGLPFYALMPEVKRSLENVYFDSAASPYLYSPEIYNEVSRLVGTEKILFGSDYPLLPPKRLLSQISTLNLDIEMQNQILADNARKLLGIN